MDPAKGLPLQKVCEFIVANGQDVPNYGRANSRRVASFKCESCMSSVTTNPRTECARSALYGCGMDIQRLSSEYCRRNTQGDRTVPTESNDVCA